MPRKTKESKESEKIEKKPSVKKVSKKTSVSTKVATSTATKSKSVSSKKDTTKKSTSTKSKSNKSNTKDITAKKKSLTKDVKSSSAKTSTKKTSSKVAKKEKPKLVEYYDLPLSYNQTVVKILYQTPTTLFVYWELSSADADNYRKIYGDNFFEKTKPVLIVHNDTLNYSFEIEINDFANSWYFNVNDSKSTYRVELGRRPVSNNNEISDKYIYISSSNIIETPNDRILFEKYVPDYVFFKNVKNNSKRLISLKELLKETPIAIKLSKLYNIKTEDLYKAIYNNETTSDLYKLMNPSSISSSF